MKTEQLKPRMEKFTTTEKDFVVIKSESLVKRFKRAIKKKK